MGPDGKASPIVCYVLGFRCYVISVRYMNVDLKPKT